MSREKLPPERMGVTNKFAINAKQERGRGAEQVVAALEDCIKHLEANSGNINTKKLPVLTRAKEALADYRTERIERFKGYVTVGLYEDGRVGEIFVKMDKQGSQISGFVDCWAIGISMLLQSGVPLEEICQKYKGAKFEPSGITDSKHPDLRFVGSPVDYIVRWLEQRFVKPQKEKARSDAS